jgi:hypothetical protein
MKNTKKLIILIFIFYIILITILLMLPGCGYINEISTPKKYHCPVNDKNYFYKMNGTKIYKFKKYKFR